MACFSSRPKVKIVEVVSNLNNSLKNPKKGAETTAARRGRREYQYQPVSNQGCEAGGAEGEAGFLMSRGRVVIAGCWASAALADVLDEFLVSAYAKILAGFSGTRN